MNKVFRIFLSLGVVFVSIAALAVNIEPEEVPILKFKEIPKFTNMPMIEKEFKGVKTREERALELSLCQVWVSEQLQDLKSENLFKYWCTYETDVILRQYSVKAAILFKSW